MGMGTLASMFGRWTVVVRVVMGLATASTILFAVALATNHWLDTIVYRKSGGSTSNDPLFYSRYQGLFRTCYTGGDARILTADTQQRNARRDTILASGDECLLDDGVIVFDVSGSKYTTDYVTRAYFLRTVIGLMSTAIVFLAIGMLVNLCGQCSNNGRSALGAGFVYLFACFSGLGATLLFTFGVVRLQNKALTKEIEFIAGWLAESKYTANNGPANQANHYVSCGWSFILATIATALALFAAVISFVAMCINKMDAKEADGEKDELAQTNAAYLPPEVVGQRAPIQHGKDVIRTPTLQQPAQAVQSQPVQQPLMMPAQQPMIPSTINDPHAYYNNQEAAHRAFNTGYPYYTIGTFNPSNPMQQKNGVASPIQQIMGDVGYGNHKATAHSKGRAHFDREHGDSQGDMIIADLM